MSIEKPPEKWAPLIELLTVEFGWKNVAWREFNYGVDFGIAVRRGSRRVGWIVQKTWVAGWDTDWPGVIEPFGFRVWPRYRTAVLPPNEFGRFVDLVKQRLSEA
jgi:hypothetical protein